MANDKDIALYSEAKGATKSKAKLFCFLKTFEDCYELKECNYFVKVFESMRTICPQ